MKVAVVGSSSINVDISNYIPPETSIIISGGSKDIDSLAEEYANAHNLKKITFKPQYSRYGKMATFVRNVQIVDEADLIVAIWNGKSHGTKFTIDYAQKIKKSLKVIIIN